MRSPWELIDALLDYAEHPWNCAGGNSSYPADRCDCGLKELVDEANRYLEAIRKIYLQEDGDGFG